MHSTAATHLCSTTTGPDHAILSSHPRTSSSIVTCVVFVLASSPDKRQLINGSYTGHSKYIYLEPQQEKKSIDVERKNWVFLLLNLRMMMTSHHLQPLLLLNRVHHRHQYLDFSHPFRDWRLILLLLHLPLTVMMGMSTPVPVLLLASVMIVIVEDYEEGDGVGIPSQPLPEAATTSTIDSLQPSYTKQFFN